MMDLAKAVEQIIGKPIEGPSDLVQISDNGKGPYISHWDESLGKLPTSDELEDAWEAYLAERAASDLADSYIAAAEAEQKKTLLELAKDLATTDSKTDAVAILEDRIAEQDAVISAAKAVPAVDVKDAKTA